MEVRFEGHHLTVEKDEDDVDRFVVDFLASFPAAFRHVLISGYIALLLGRTRMTEDVDMFLVDPGRSAFLAWFERSGFECLQTATATIAYDDYLAEGIALRFSRPGQLVPNMEVKFPKRRTDHIAVRDAMPLWLGSHPAFTSPLEMQIAFKVWMASQKDLEDAQHMFLVARDHLDMPTLMHWLDQFNAKEEHIRAADIG